ncbi:MAG: hypothetical protein IJ418_02215 [Clostridia bacterium]|nr:hypothetical protein [Clostridia bacterium]MBQ8616306.1 hypothetical protein [Clostridia bacterium]
MSCNTGIYTVMNTPAAVAAGGTVPLGTIIRRFGCGLDLNGNGVTLLPAGYYKADVNLTVLPTAAGAITATLLVDGVAYPGAVATGTPTAAGAAVNLNIPALIRNVCAGAHTLTVVLDVAATVNNAAVAVVKV